jgi:pyruvate/2-oxoglutarate dehydrogenase complex dihydrolipoamide acyltransferase (E2) component
MADVRLPKWGVSMTEATVVRWHRAHGEQVREGEALVDLETDKVETTMDAPTSGTLVEIRVDAGESVPVGTVLAVIV